MRTLIITILFLIFSASDSKTQVLILSGNIGLSKSIVEYSPSIKDIFQDYNDIGWKGNFEIGLEYSPCKTLLSIRTGLGFLQSGNRSIDLYYLRLPLILQLNLGRKFKFSLGGGIYNGFLLSYNIKNEYSRFENSKSNYDFGFLMNIGFKYYFHKQYGLSLDYQNSFGMKTIYVGTLGKYPADYQSRSTGFTIGFIYILK